MCSIRRFRDVRAEGMSIPDVPLHRLGPPEGFAADGAVGRRRWEQPQVDELEHLVALGAA